MKKIIKESVLSINKDILIQPKTTEINKVEIINIEAISLQIRIKKERKTITCIKEKRSLMKVMEKNKEKV